MLIVALTSFCLQENWNLKESSKQKSWWLTILSAWRMISEEKGINIWRERYKCLKWKIPISEVKGTNIWKERYKYLKRRVPMSEKKGTNIWSERYQCLKRKVPSKKLFSLPDETENMNERGSSFKDVVHADA